MGGKEPGAQELTHEHDKPSLTSDYDGSAISEDSGLRLRELSEPLAARLAATPSSQQRETVEQIDCPKPALLDLVLIVSNEDKDELATLLLARLSHQLSGETEAMRYCARLLANQRFALAAEFVDLLMPRITNRIVLASMINVVREHYYRSTISSTPCHNTADVERLCQQLSALAIRLSDTTRPLRVARLYSCAERPEFLLADAPFQAALLHPAAPQNIDDRGQAQPARNYDFSADAGQFYHLPNARLIGGRPHLLLDDCVIDDALVRHADPGEFTPHGPEKIYAREIYHYARTPPDERWVIINDREPTREIARGILLNGPYQNNFWHWLAEYLILLPAIESLPDCYANWPLLISREALAHPNLEAALKLAMRNAQRPIEIIERDEAVKIGELIVPPRLAYVKSCMTRLNLDARDIMLEADAVRQLHARLALPGRGKRRFFLARNGKIRLDNQAEVQQIFEQYGFETIYPEQLDFQSARELFSQAAIIAGPTGAAFANLLLCPPGTTALIMVADLYPEVSTFSAIAAPLGQRVIHISGRSHTPDSIQTRFTAPAERIHRLLDIIDQPARPEHCETTPDSGIAADAERDRPLVSILIPAYKSRWFEPALVSALSQDYPKTEIIVFDNCPTESIRLICERYPEVRYWLNPNKRLQNILDIVAASSGRYVKFLFDDDLLEPDCVSELVRAITRELGTQLAFAKSWTIDENDVRQNIRPDIETPHRHHLFDGNAVCRRFALDCANMIGEFSSVLFDGEWLRADLRRIHVGNNSGAHFPGLTDVIAFMNAAADRPVAFVNAPLTSFRLNSESNSNPDKNPDYLFAITDWRLIIDEAHARGILYQNDLSDAQNSYNNLASVLAERCPALAADILKSRYPVQVLPSYQNYLQGETLLSMKKIEEAIGIFLQLADKKTCIWQVYDRLGDHARKQHDDALAYTYYATALRKAGDPIAKSVEYARFLLETDRRDDARQLVSRYLQHVPADPEALHLLDCCNARPTNPPIPPAVCTPAAYRRWQVRHEDDSPRGQFDTDSVSRPVLFELLMMLDPGAESLLADSIDSLAQQESDDWRLSIFSETAPPVPEFEASDSSVRWIWILPGQRRAELVDERLAASPADWLGFFECGTRFAPGCLRQISHHIAAHPDSRLIYADEDGIGLDSERCRPLFKPDFNLELLRSTDYVGNLVVERHTLLKAGGYSKTPGAENYDLILRVADACGDCSIGHLPEVLYHVPAAAFRRATDTAARQALRAHLGRRQIAAGITDGLLPSDSRRILYRHSETPRVSIIVPTRNRLDLLGPCVESLLKNTDYPDWELILVDNNSDDPAVNAYYDNLCAALPDRVHLLRHPGPFDFAAMNNRAAEEARGDYLLLLNNDTECIHDDWLTAMMAHAQRPDVGIVGARLLFPGSLRIQHAGVVLGLSGNAGHVFVEEITHDDPGYLSRAMVDQEYSAVSGACLLIRAALYREIGGLDEQAFKVSFNDIDLCLKACERGYRVIWTPFATLLHHGSASQLADQQSPEKARAFRNEADAFHIRWQHRLTCDPAWNRNLSLSCTTPTLEDELAAPWTTDFQDRPRILIMPTSSMGAAEYRNIGPLRALHEAGKLHYAAVCQPATEKERAPSPVELARMAPDTLVMHAPVDNLRCLALLQYKVRNPGIFRIYSLDDLITNLPKDNPNYHALPAQVITERLQLGLAACHRMIVSTEPLLNTYRHLIDDIRLLPNRLSLRLWGDQRSLRRTGKKLRVGWAGAQQHAGDLRFVLDIVKASYQEVDWIFFGMLPEGAKPYVAEFHDYVHRLNEYPAKLASLNLDLAIAPLEIHPFNEAKSNLRLLEYGILGWPVICSDILPYRTDNPPVLRLPNDAGRWLAAIRERVADPDALARDGDALQAWVRRNYILEDHLDPWFDALTR